MLFIYTAATMWIRRLFQSIIVLFALIGFAFTAVYFAVKFGLTDSEGVIDEQTDAFIEDAERAFTNQKEEPAKPLSPQFSPWHTTHEWEILKTGILKDREVINRAAADSGVPARLIVTQLAVEQLRLFYSDREAFKKWFEPLKILGNQTQFSWGVMGMKEHTAIQVEEHLIASTSPYYIGTPYETLLQFNTNDHDEERFARMTNKRDHYYSYLYAGLYLRQIMTQWERAGYSIAERPEILSTLYNIGFAKSVPNPDPKSGGAEIIIDGVAYSFGSLGASIYNSDELLTEFPR